MEKSLKDLISRLPIPGLREAKDRKIIAEILTQTLHIPIKTNQIGYKDHIITVSIQPVVKSALQIKQEEILTKLGKEGVLANKIH